MQRWWVRFWTTSEDYRPMFVPFKWKWWCTGHRFDPFANSICMVADAESEDEILKAIKEGWPEVASLDFCQTKEPSWMPESTRFPVENDGKSCSACKI